MHQGYEFCFFIPGEADPVVFQYVEGQACVFKPWTSFSSFVAATVAAHLTQWPNLGS